MFVTSEGLPLYVLYFEKVSRTATCVSAALSVVAALLKRQHLREWWGTEQWLMDQSTFSLPAQDLALYKKFRNKEVASAARGLVGLFRELAPGLLEKRDRGRGADVTVAPAAYGAATVAARIPGAELLQAAEAREAAGEASEGEPGSGSDDDEGVGGEDEEGFDGVDEEGFDSGGEDLQVSGSEAEAEAAGDGEAEVSDADDAGSNEEEEAGVEDLEERGSGSDADGAAASEARGADDRLSGGEGPSGGAEAPNEEAGSDSAESSASDEDSAGPSGEAHEADARAAGRERDVLNSRWEARRERAGSGAAAGPSAGARLGSGSAAGLKRARAPEAESLQSLKRRLKGVQARRAAADPPPEQELGPGIGRRTDGLAAQGSHKAGGGREADGDGTGADKAGVPGGVHPDLNADGGAGAGAHLPLEHGRILSGEDFARMRELRHKAMVAAAMRKHGLKSASKRGRLLAAAEEEAEEALAAQVSTHFFCALEG